jgi:hypothetical protein
MLVASDAQLRGKALSSRWLGSHLMFYRLTCSLSVPRRRAPLDADGQCQRHRGEARLRREPGEIGSRFVGASWGMLQDHMARSARPTRMMGRASDASSA